MIKEAIILAGGLGTRLRSVVADAPKCMAPVRDKPFLSYLIFHLQKMGIEKFVFSLGYMHDLIEDYLQKNYSFLDYTLSVEEEPLGTGGAILQACSKVSTPDVLVCNGDTLYITDGQTLSNFHKSTNALCTLCLKPMNDFDRYGVVELNADGSVRSFKEKKYYASGLINGGVYALNAPRFLKESLPQKFSFEKDFLEKNVGADVAAPKLYGVVQDGYFIDIGIPEDYSRAQKELQIQN